MFRNHVWIAFAMSLAGLQGGCALLLTQERAVRARAATDLSCSARDVEVTEVSNRRFVASGCGDVRYYTCLQGGCIHDE